MNTRTWTSKALVVLCLLSLGLAACQPIPTAPATRLTAASSTPPPEATATPTPPPTETRPAPTPTPDVKPSLAPSPTPAAETISPRDYELSDAESWLANPPQLKLIDDKTGQEVVYKPVKGKEGNQFPVVWKSEQGDMRYVLSRVEGKTLLMSYSKLGNFEVIMDTGFPLVLRFENNTEKMQQEKEALSKLLRFMFNLRFQPPPKPEDKLTVNIIAAEHIPHSVASNAAKGGDADAGWLAPFRWILHTDQYEAGIGRWTTGYNYDKRYWDFTDSHSFLLSVLRLSQPIPPSGKVFKNISPEEFKERAEQTGAGKIGVYFEQIP